MSDDFREKHLRDRDFVGAFGVLRREGAIALVANARVIRGEDEVTWDLPGGQVEPGELLLECLRRELDEELGIVVTGEPQFLFFQEGERLAGERRLHTWRSFFFAVDRYDGEPTARGEVLGLRWIGEQEIGDLLGAPYHDSFLDWLRAGGTCFRSRWSD